MTPAERKALAESVIATALEHGETVPEAARLACLAVDSEEAA